MEFCLYSSIPNSKYSSCPQLIDSQDLRELGDTHTTYYEVSMYLSVRDNVSNKDARPTLGLLIHEVLTGFDETYYSCF